MKTSLDLGSNPGLPVVKVGQFNLASLRFIFLIYRTERLDLQGS